MSSSKANGGDVVDSDNLDGVLEDVRIDNMGGDNDYNGAVAQQQQGSIRRFKGWTVLFVANLVCVIAIALGRPKGTTAEKWSKWILSLSFVFSFAPIVVHFSAFARALFTSVVELGLVRNAKLFRLLKQLYVTFSLNQRKFFGIRLE
jgi:hypothetical protein